MEQISENRQTVYPYENALQIKRKNFVYRFVKRAFDFFSASLLMLVLLCTLIFPLITLIVAIKMKGNPFFVQIRPGKNGKLFKMLKYRTMTNEKDENGNLLPDDVRLTPFGKNMRKLSLDEIPELFNIIKGDMSVVGPRPQLVRDMVFFSEDAMKRQSVRPGLTGYAQVNGRNNVTWEEKFDLDLQYLSKRSLLLDCKVLFQTILKVLSSDDVATEGMETAEDYGAYLLRIDALSLEEFEQKQSEAKEMIAAFTSKKRRKS